MPENHERDWRVEEINGLKQKFWLTRKICYAVFSLFVIIVLADIFSKPIAGAISWISGLFGEGNFSYELAISSFWIWLGLTLPWIIWYVSHCIKFVKAWEKLVVFRWGKFYGDKPRDPGAKWIWYILDTVRFVKMWEQTIDPPPQEVITKDNIRTQVNPIIFFKVEDPISYIGGAEKTLQMIASLSETIIRDICGTKEFEEIREEREKLSLYITHILNVASGVEESTPEERASGIYIPSEKTKDPLIKGWGIRVTRVKLQGIEPPQEIVEALQKKFIAKQEADAKIEVARGDFEASKKRSDAKRYDFEQEGEGKGILIAKQVKPLNEPGGERYTAIEVAKTVKDGDKIIFTDDSVKGITGALAGMFTGRLPKPKDD